MDHATLAEITLWLLAVILAATVILDGFDLGVGILCLFEPSEERRTALMGSIEGVWHANQTWLVVLGSVLFGGFPLAYGTFLSALYVPAGLMLAALMARGIGIEYHAEGGHKRFWSNLFALGSLGTALLQGAMLGAVIAGLPLAGHVHFDAPLAWIGPGAALGAAAMACLVTLLGAGWAAAHVKDFKLHAIAGTAGLSGLAFQAGLALLVPVSGALAAVTAAVSLGCLSGALAAARSGRKFFTLSALHALTCLVAWLLALRPGFTGPMTPLAASAAPGSLTVMLTGYAIVLPIIAAYSIYQYRVFGGQGAYEPGEEH